MVLAFENEIACVTFTPEEGVKAKTYKINIYAANKSDGGSKQHVYASKVYPLKKGKNTWRILIESGFYNAVAKKVVSPGNPLPNIIEFFFSVIFDQEEEEVPDTLTIHFVGYIPKLMNILGWSSGEKLQRIWFTKGNNVEKNDVDPEVDIISWDWAISESDQVKGEYEEFFRDIKESLNGFFDNKRKESLRIEINKMIADGMTTLPTETNPKTDFGTFDKTIITYKGEKMPLYEKYYFYSKSFSGPLDIGLHYLWEGFDDFVASLAAFNYHVFAKGQLVYDPGGFFSGPSVKIKVTQLAFYIKDSFDFIDDDPNEPSQPLGFWKILANKIEVERSPSNKEEYFEVTNKSYRDYRDDHGMGYNYHVYSTLNIQPVNIELSL